MSEKINNKLLELGIKLPKPADPVASYLPYVISGNLLFISGQGPFNENGLITGKVGSDLTLDEGKDAAKDCGKMILAQVQKACGNLSKIQSQVVGLRYYNVYGYGEQNKGNMSSTVFQY